MGLSGGSLGHGADRTATVRGAPADAAGGLRVHRAESLEHHRRRHGHRRAAAEGPAGGSGELRLHGAPGGGGGHIRSIDLYHAYAHI